MEPVQVCPPAPNSKTPQNNSACAPLLCRPSTHLPTSAEFPQLPADDNVSQSVGQTSVSHDQTQPTLTRQDWELQKPGTHSLELQFQDSNLSPALSLLPVNAGVEHNFTEYSLFQHSDYEFVPLRAYPDVSMASDRFHFPLHDRSARASEGRSLSQHPLAQATVLSEGEASSCSLSQHSLSPGDEGRHGEMVHSQLTATADRQEYFKTLHKLAEKAEEDEAFFLRKDVPAQHLMELLQKDVGMPSSTSSAVSSASETSVKSITSLAKDSESTEICKPALDQSLVRREGPPGEASLPEQQTKLPNRVSNPDQSPTSEVCNITMGSRSTQPDNTSEVLHRELLSEVERCNNRKAESKSQHRKCPSPGQCVTPYPTETSESKPSVTRTNQGDIPWTGLFSTGVQRLHREQDLWSSGNQTGIDGSYLGFLPHSQSTPGVFKAPPKSSVKATVGQLSAIDSNKESSYQSSSGISPQPAVPETDAHSPDTANQCQEEHPSAKVQSLPSLNYLQKVDAWRSNQNSGKTSLFDSLALQGFSGISPKKKAYDAVSDTLNRILSEQARNFQQPPISSASNQNVTQSSSTAPSGSSSPRRGEAVGRAPSDKDDTGPAARPSGSPSGRSRSQSSLNTVVISVEQNQQTLKPTEKDKSQIQDNVHHQLSTTAQASPLMSLGQFSDVSTDRDLTLSNSQDSYNSGMKLGASIGASSVTSLEVDNYASHWTSLPSTPPPLPKPRDLNIEERIPLYLHNLGIDQSPSTILTPFAPRGPIREPEFSPTDLCTIKGSIGTPTKSSQPSEGGSPHKGEFSRSSVLSVDSTVSIPFSLDSLGPAVSIPEHTKRTASSPSSDTGAVQNKCSLTLSSQADEGSHPSILEASQQQQKDNSVTSSQSSVQLGNRLNSHLSITTKLRCGERDVQMSHSLDQSAEDSFVSSKAFGEIHKLLSQVDNVVSAGPSAASSASPAAPRLLSDDNILLSLRKNDSRLKDSSLSPLSATANSRTHSSLLWARSSSDSMLTSEKPRQSSVVGESLTSTWQPDYSSTQSLISEPAADAYKRLQECTVSRGAGPSLVLSKSARRAEPEGCSAAPPDNKVPTQPPVIRPLPTVSKPQLTSTETATVPEEEDKTSDRGPAPSSTPTPSLGDTDQGVMSDGSSDSSLAVRVAKLLQSESPTTMVSSTPSLTDQEDSKAREWINMKVSGQQCEPLELDKEDRKRIEEIKRELMLKYPIKSQLSTDTESSAASSVRDPRGRDPPDSTETFTAPRDAHNQLSQPQQGLGTNLSNSHMKLQNSVHKGLEAQVWEIAAREGVSLPRPNPRALTSITIATRKRSTSPSPSTSPAPPISPAPEPLHLTELSTVGHPQANCPPVKNEADNTTREPAAVLETSRNQRPNQTRQSAVGCQFEEPPPPSQDFTTENSMQSFQKDEEISIQDSFVPDAHRAEQTKVSSTSETSTRTGHVSHVHLTLSPKATEPSLPLGVESSHNEVVKEMPHREFVPLRHSPSAASSLDEGVGLSSPPDWYESPQPKRQQGRERVDTSALFKALTSTGRFTPTSKQTFTPRYRHEASQRPVTTESPAVPVLLPYKPRGSEELFYIPQAEADVSSTGPSDTTMESSHTGSDDAVPPHFSSEVLGHQDPGLDRGVTIKHTEGIYSKRLKTASFKMQSLHHREAPVTANKSSQTSYRQTLKPSSQVSVALTGVPLSNNQEPSNRDQDTSPLQSLHYNRPGPSRERFQPVHVGTEDCYISRPLGRRSDPPKGEDQHRRKPYTPQLTSQQNNISLDELWQRFCDQWIAETRPNRQASLVERLERLSRLIQSTRGANMSEEKEVDYHSPYNSKQKEGSEERRHDVWDRETDGRVGGSRKADDEPPILRYAWTQKTSEPSDKDSRASFTCSSSLSQHLCPADRDEAETSSTASGSMSTIDTARLIRVFGAHRVQHLKSSSSLSKLYSTINKQKEGRQQRRGRNKDSPSIMTPTESAGTDGSTAAPDSASTTSTSTVPSHRGPSKTLTEKKAVKLATKGIQTGDLEIVRNGTRRHTRDVGTTFPSPHEYRTSRQNSSSSSVERGRGGWRSPSKTETFQRPRKNKRSPPKLHPEGVSWFISAEDLRLEARKENRQQEEESWWRPSTAWFEPYSRSQPWREPLRQRQVHEDRNQQPDLSHNPEPDPEPRTKTKSPALARISLQEALEISRPEFISRSTQRVKRLALQAEERKLQAVFSRERHELFNQHGGPGRLPRPAGAALRRRAVPRKEMIQRSKQIYENLPEVQRRREEERRKAEYRSYRLNAQLYNKRITNRVLGRQTAWQ
ncbi:mucin-5AC isoform X2 [Echeneis naucrates]|uniref:mucin-5AC isoform X2 n=1 Tax=Echeneis naucrates TaxID=173247 RepID=UPI00111356F8|nr:Alstrom syndrome protein 1 isoform X2 [Echeneis naucrates]